MRVASFLLFSAVNVSAFISALYLAEDTHDPAGTILLLLLLAWLSFVLCLSVFVAGASAENGSLELPQSVTQLIFLFALAPLFSLTLGLTINFQNYKQLALSARHSRGGEVTRVDEVLVRLSGNIGPRTLSSLAEEQKKGKIEFLELDSSGGIIDVADEVGEFLMRHEISTFVQSECLSACVIVALSGKNLLVTPDASFGFHRGSSAADINSELGRFISKTATSDMMEILSRKGVPQEILDKAEDTPAHSMYYVTGRTMYQIGLAHLIFE